MKSGPDGFERLTCSCGTSKFARVSYLRWKQGAGVTEEPGGYFCLECHAIVDGAKLITAAQLRAKQRELKELQDEIGLPRNEEQANATAGGAVSGHKAGR